MQAWKKTKILQRTKWNLICTYVYTVTPLQRTVSQDFSDKGKPAYSGHIALLAIDSLQRGYSVLYCNCKLMH